MFWMKALRLCWSVVCEGLVNGIHLAVFPLRRRRVRARIQALMENASWRQLGVVGALLASFAAGCGSLPGTSFEDQVESTVWSVERLVEMPGWKEGLQMDLEGFLDPRPDLDQLPETFRLWGW
jgi:hypothetical protein